MVKFCIMLYIVALSVVCGYEYVWLKKTSAAFSLSMAAKSPKIRAQHINELDAKLTIESIRREEMKVLGLKNIPFTPWTNEMRSNAPQIYKLNEDGSVEINPPGTEIVDDEETDEPCPDGSTKGKDECKWKPLN